jgi:hypothetical protein
MWPATEQFCKWFRCFPFIIIGIVTSLNFGKFGSARLNPRTTFLNITSLEVALLWLVFKIRHMRNYPDSIDFKLGLTYHHLHNPILLQTN